MHSFDFEAVTYDASIYCVGCLPEGLDENSEGVSPIFADSEWDHYPVCDECHAEHDYVSLTAEGVKQRKLSRYAEAVRDYADEKTGDLAPYAWPGGYPLFYLGETRNEYHGPESRVLCPKCASDHEGASDEKIVAGDVNWEDGNLDCEECNEPIEAAYVERGESVDGEEASS